MKNTQNSSLEEAFDRTFPEDVTPSDTLHARVASIAEDTERQRRRAGQAKWHFKRRYGLALGLVGITGAMTYSFVQTSIAPQKTNSPLQNVKNMHLVAREWTNKSLISRRELWKQGGNWAYYYDYMPYINNKNTIYTPQKALINGVFYNGSYIKDTNSSTANRTPYNITGLENILGKINVLLGDIAQNDRKLSPGEQAINNTLIEKNGKKIRQFIVDYSTVWIDEQTHLPIRIFHENTSNNVRTGEVTIVTESDVAISYDETPPSNTFQLTKEMEEAKDMNLARPLLAQKLAYPMQIKKLNQTELRILSVDANKQGDIFIVFALPENVEFQGQFGTNITGASNTKYSESSSINCNMNIDKWNIYSICAGKKENTSTFTPTTLSLALEGRYIKVNTPLSKVKIPFVEYPIWGDIDQEDITLTFPIIVPTCDVIPEIIRLASDTKDPIDAWEFERNRRLQEIRRGNPSISWEELENDYQVAAAKPSSRHTQFSLNWAVALTALGREDEARAMIQKAQVEMDEHIKRLPLTLQKERKGSLVVGTFLYGSTTAHPKHKGDKYPYDPLSQGSSYLREQVKIAVKQRLEKEKKTRLVLREAKRSLSQKKLPTTK
jgi:hypothetical protein